MKSCRKWEWFAILLCACVAGSLPARADEDCRLTQLASLDMRDENLGRILVPATLNGHEMNLALDTGSHAGFLSESTANELGLTRQMMNVGWQYRMLSGEPAHEATTVNDFSLGGMPGKNIRFGIMSDSEFGPHVPGSLGADIMRHYDIELDFAHHKVNLFSRQHCPGKVVYWTRDPYAAIPFHFAEDGALLFKITVDDVSMPAVLNTAYPAAFTVDIHTARDMFQWSGDPTELRPMGGQSTSFTYPFHVLSLGGATVREPTTEVRAYKYYRPEGAAVGVDALRPFRVYISYDDAAIYLTARDAH